MPSEARRPDLFSLPAPGRRPDTSRAAGDKIQDLLRGFRADVYRTIARAEPDGLTTSEIASVLGRYRTVQPRTSELKQWGLIHDSGERRDNEYGNPEIVWRVGPS